jgi:hypothetical protein
MRIRSSAVLVTLAGVSLTLAFGQTRTVEGVVVDQEGHPVSGVMILLPARNGGRRETSSMTRPDGRFQIRTPATTALFRKMGFTSNRVPVIDSSNLRVVLKRAPTETMPLCGETRACIHNPTLVSTLCFPQVDGVVVREVEPGLDSVTRQYRGCGQSLTVFTGQGSHTERFDGTAFGRRRSS